MMHDNETIAPICFS